MRILVTGGAGYLGSVLVPTLLARGYDVRVVDIGLFGVNHLPEDAEVILGDVLDFDEAWLDGVQAVIHLAGLSNDPMAEFSPRLNYLLNSASPAIVATAAKKAGIKRFIFASTCSVYGLSDSREMGEDDPVSPCPPYPVSKLMAERALLCLTDDTFLPIILRKGTVVGWSSRMRYDLVVNTMVKTAITQGKIVVYTPSQWRPIIDVRDVATAYVRALDSDPTTTGIFNIAYDNYTIGRLADEVAATLQEHGITAPLDILNRQDQRSYRVSMKKAYSHLDFRASIPPAQSATAVFENLHDPASLDDPLNLNVEWMKRHLIDGRLEVNGFGI